MVKIRIQPAPESLSPEKLRSILENIVELRPIINKANTKYIYWDKFKYYKIPGKIKASEAWNLLKITRQTQLMRFPLNDIRGHAFSYWLPDVSQKSLHEIDFFSAGQLASETPIRQSHDTKQRYIISSLMDEAIASSKIEGAASTRKKAKELLRTGRKPVSTFEKMIVNNYRTIRKIRNLKDEKLTPEMIIELQSLLTDGTLDDPKDSGRLRDTDDVRVVDSSGNILHEPPLAKELPERIKLICEFANSNKHDLRYIHPVIKAILLHFWLAYDHPFADGNGRTARAIFYWYMLSNGYWLFEYLSLSSEILKNQKQYEKSYLYSEQDGLDATYFITYNLRIIEKALSGLHGYIKRKQEEQKQITDLLSGNLKVKLNIRQKILLRHALDNQRFIYTIESHQNSQGVAYPTARSDLLELTKHKLLILDESNKQLRFSVPNDLLDRLKK